jgi:hypothetical protein
VGGGQQGEVACPETGEYAGEVVVRSTPEETQYKIDAAEALVASLRKLEVNPEVIKLAVKQLDALKREEAAPALAQSVS